VCMCVYVCVCAIIGKDASVGTTYNLMRLLRCKCLCQHRG